MVVLDSGRVLRSEIPRCTRKDRKNRRARLQTSRKRQNSCRFCGGVGERRVAGRSAQTRNEVDHYPLSWPRVFIDDRRKSHRQQPFFVPPLFFSLFHPIARHFLSFVLLVFFFPDNWLLCLSATGHIRKLFGIMEFTWTPEVEPSRRSRGDVFSERGSKWNNPVCTKTANPPDHQRIIVRLQSAP